MPRAIDHLVIPAHDLARQAELYRRLGFQVGARNRHPWGTENHVIQFDGGFLELIGLGESFVAPAPPAAVYPFAGFVARFLERREGLAMLAMRSSDAEADRREFARATLGEFWRFDFGRKATRPDGRQVDVAFSLAFAASPAFAETGFFVCQQHFPENFWGRLAQVHPNGAIGITGLAFAHDDPEAAARFLTPFLDAAIARREGPGLTIEIDGATIEVAPRGALRERYGDETIPSDGAPLALARIGVADVSQARRVLADNRVAARRWGDALAIAADDAMGAALVFEPAEAAPIPHDRA